MRARFLVPLVAALVVIIAPASLIGIMVRSPYTHANLAPGFDSSYTRSEATRIGAPMLYGGSSLAVNLSATTPLEERGKALLAARGCGNCHGIDGQGGIVAPAIIPDLEVLRDNVRRGPGGMPVFSSQDLTDYDLTALAVYLKSASK